MKISWGYSPKLEQFIPLGDFSADKYLIIARQAIANLGWKLGHISKSGILAYTGLSLQSYSEEISIRIQFNFAVFKSECVGIQLLCTDYGKNSINAEKFFHEFDYVEYHLQDVWEQQLEDFRQIKETADDGYFDRSPLAAKQKIKNIFYLFYPQKGYLVTPILINLNILMFLFTSVAVRIFLATHQQEQVGFTEARVMAERLYTGLGASTGTLLGAGQWWRLITCQFFHFSLSHLFGNMYALVYVGLIVEPKLGSLKTLSVYFLSGIAAVIFCTLFRNADVLGGASGAVFGMFGALLALVSLKAYEKSANVALMISTALVIVLLLMNGLWNSKIAQSAHVGGVISGFILTYAIYQVRWFGKNWNVLIRVALGSVVLGTFLLIIFAAIPKNQAKDFNRLQQTYFQNSAVFNEVYRMSASTNKEERLLVISKGMKSWKDNQYIVKQMDSLNLNERSEMIVDYDKRVADQGYALAQLMYIHTLSGDDSKLKEIKKRARAMNVLVYELNKKINTPDN